MPYLTIMQVAYLDFNPGVFQNIFLVFMFIIETRCEFNVEKDSFLSDIPSLCPANISIHGLILARAGSKGIVNKNLAQIQGISLLGKTIKAMTAFKKFSSIWVSTDGRKIADEAQKFGANVHWRKKETATDTATSLFAMQEFLSSNQEIENIALLQCTSPFLQIKYLNSAYELMQQGFDSVFSATREYKLRWTENFEGDIEPLNFDPASRPRRQDWNGELIENGMFYFTRKNFIEKGLIQAGRIGIVEIPKYFNIEIDTIEDLKLAQLLSANFEYNS
ncbi:hypothetical protein B566_EDAN008616 [Ephemera danica]|nr:hypothetical protein B566_EDAN008616 [Ephemera danica]